MQKRMLGRSGIAIAPIVFGGNVFGWTADTARSFELLDHFVARGFNAIDTADVYSDWAPGHSGGESETVIGKWLSQRGRRDDVVLMTKVGLLANRKGLAAANIERAVEDSLRRLQTDYIDVYFAHRDDESVPLDETLEAFARLVASGKVRTLGGSNYTADRFRQALTVAAQKQIPRYEVLQPEYNLYDRAEFEGELARVAQEEQVGVVSYFALASGFLTGKYKSIEECDDSGRGAFVKRYFDARGQRILDDLLAVSADLGAKPAQIALAWLLSRPALTAPIVSATTLAQLDELLAAPTLTLPQAALDRLDTASRYS